MPKRDTHHTPERPETWTAEQLEKRHRIATLAVQMDLAMRGTLEDRMRFSDALEAAPISQKLRRAFRNVEIDYAILCANARDAQNEVHDAAPDINFGEWLFMQRTLTHPVGKVTAVCQEGYIVVTCDKREDYVAFRGFDPSNPKPSIGSYHRALRFTTPIRHAPISAIVIDGSRPTHSITTTIDHERQHWVNDRVLSAFGRTERPAKANEFDTNPKDEILAYLRDGASGTSIENAILKTGAYPHLFTVDAAERTAAIQRIAATMNRADALAPKEARATLVAQLYDIPFKEIPRALDVFAAYYEERRALAYPATPYFLSLQPHLEVCKTTIFPRSLHVARQAFQEQYTALEAQRAAAMHAIYGSDGTFVSREELAAIGERSTRAIRDALTAYEQLLERLTPDEAMLPTALLPDVHSPAQRQKFERIAQDMIDIACTIPQPDIDRAFQEADQHGVDFRLRALAERYLRTLSQHTGRRYEVTVAHTSRDLQLHITQEATDAMPRVRFVVTLHPSQTALAQAQAA